MALSYIVLHAFSISRGHGLSTATLQIVFRAIDIAKFCCAPSWRWGVNSAGEEIHRLTLQFVQNGVPQRTCEKKYFFTICTNKLLICSNKLQFVWTNCQFCWTNNYLFEQINYIFEQITNLFEQILIYLNKFLICLNRLTICLYII